MDDNHFQAKVIALESALQAILLTRSKPADAHQKFNEIWGGQVRELNKASPDNAQLTKAIQAECALLGGYFRAYSTN